MTGQHPRLERLVVENFQSIKKADIELGGFTVIVGPSNSGKSALLRALKAVVRNVNSPSAVRVGKNTFTARVEFEGGDSFVAIERGKAHSTYRIGLPDGREEVYTKAGRSVPDDVQGFLALPDPTGPDLVFSSQIDPPFLLSETGSTVAKTIGDLTNVSKLHAAAKEANRRRSEATRVQKLRSEDAFECFQKMQAEFSDLPATKAALAEARSQFEAVSALAREKDELTAILSSLNVLDAAEKDLLSRLEDLPKPEDIEAMASHAGSLLGERETILEALTVLSRLSQADDLLNAQMSEAEEAAEKSEKEYHEALVLAGKCPTCGQEVSS